MGVRAQEKGGDVKYKLEIIADSMGELMARTKVTVESVSTDPELIRRVESKGMSSVFFTEHANIVLIDGQDREPATQA